MFWQMYKDKYRGVRCPNELVDVLRRTRLFYQHEVVRVASSQPHC